jgi:hypothetical protein
MKSLREIVQDHVLGSLNLAVETKAALAQLISDFAIGCDLSPILSDERIDAGYTVLSKMSDQRDIYKRLHIIEAYNVVYAEEEASFAVDRSSLYDESNSKTMLDPAKLKAELACIEKGVKDWFQSLLVSKRVGRNDLYGVVRDAMETKVLVEANPELVLGTMLPLLTDGQIKLTFTMPKLFHHGSEAPTDFGKFIEAVNYQEPKTMYCQVNARITNLPRATGSLLRSLCHKQSTAFPFWEKKQLIFHMESVTYKDQPTYCM